MSKLSAEIYSSPNCGYCTMAKKLLEKENIPYIEIDAPTNREQLIERVEKASGKRPSTVPQIFLNGQYIGGYTELNAYINAAQ